MFGCRIPFSGISGTAFHFFKIKLQLIYAISRSSHQRCPMRKDVLRNFAKFTRKHLCQSLFLNKVAGLNPVNFAKFLRKLFYRTRLDDCFYISNYCDKANGLSHNELRAQNLTQNIIRETIKVEKKRWIKTHSRVNGRLRI